MIMISNHVVGCVGAAVQQIRIQRRAIDKLIEGDQLPCDLRSFRGGSGSALAKEQDNTQKEGVDDFYNAE